MGGITTGVGIFSGIDSGSLIEQLIAAQSRPQILATRRLVQLQSQQSAYLDINARLNAFKTAAASFRVNDIFSGKNAFSSDDTILTASATNSAINGSYNFIVDRLVTSQQLLSRGFADDDSSSVGIDSITLEGVEGRLDRDTALADLNNGNGITRGKIVINGTTVDLSTVGTVGELLDTINDAGTGSTASVSGGSIVLSDVTSLADASGYDVLESIGLTAVTNGSPADVTGSQVYGLGTNTALASLNDGRGVGTRDVTGEGVYDFNIIVDGADTIGIRLGDIEEIVDDELVTTSGAVSTVGQAISRINTALADAGFSEITASIDETNGRLVINDTSGRSIEVQNFQVNGADVSTTATDLGIETSSPATGTITGERVLAGLNTTLVSSLNGGNGLNGAGNNLVIVPADSSGSFTIDVSGATTVQELIDTINNDAGNNSGGSPKVIASLNENGNGIRIVDNTGGTDGLGIIGSTATQLGLFGTYSDGIADGENVQLAYLGLASQVSELNNGEGIGTGKFEITDSFSNTATITIGAGDTTLGHIISKINNSGLAITARINDQGDGIIIEEDSGTPGGANITITDTEGGVAEALRIAGESAGTAGDNYIDGSYEVTIDFDPSDTLRDVVTKINEAGAGARAAIINSGSGANPYKLNIFATSSGSAGQFIIDSGDFDLGLTTLEEGQDARVFYGSTDPASGVLISSSTNSLDGVIDGVSIDLLKASEDPVTLTVSTNSDEIETQIGTLVSTFNAIIERIDFQTRYDEETEQKGVLLGDGTTLTLRNRLFSALQNTNDGFSGRFSRLTEVGIRVGEGGKLEFNKDTFRAAYALDPDAVEDLFSRRDLEPVDEDPDDDGIIISNPDAEPSYSALGIIPQLELLADDYVSSIGGVLQNRTNAIDNQIQLQEQRIESIQRGLDAQREILQRQFLAMEQAIASFQTQGSALSQIQLIG